MFFVERDDITKMSMEQLVVRKARLLVDSAEYVYRYENCNPPQKVSCSVFVWWVFTCCGVSMPRISTQLLKDLLELGDPVNSVCLKTACLIFSAGRKHEHSDSKRAKKGVGHVGIATETGSVIHASYLRRMVVEEPIERFLSGGNHFRGCYKVH